MAVDWWDSADSENVSSVATLGTAAAAPASTAPPETTSPPETSSTSRPTPDEPAPLEAEPFRYSYLTIDELPDLPTEVVGYVASGDVQRSSTRVFESSGEFETVYEFPTQGNRCEEGFWIARWVSASADVLLYATNEIYINDAASFVFEEWLLPPPGPAGMLAEFSCMGPGFRWASSDSGIEGNLVDVIVEWQYFELDYFGTTEQAPPAAPEQSTCSDYVYNDELPIDVCSRGFSVELFQEALGLNPDGFFGPGTETAVRAFQTQSGLTASGVMTLRHGRHLVSQEVRHSRT